MKDHEGVGRVKKKLAVRPVVLFTPNVVHTLPSIGPCIAPCPPHPRLRWLRMRHQEAHLLQSFNYPIMSIRHRHRRHLASIAPSVHDVHSSGLANPSSRDALPSGRPERLVHNVLLARTPTRLP